MGLVNDFFKKLDCKDKEAQQLERYDRMLVDLLGWDSAFTLTNSGLKHALIANRHLISGAKNEIHIFTPTKEFFHDGIYSGMKEWVPENVQVNIISTTDENDLFMRYGKPPDNVNIVQASRVFLDAVRKRFKCINYFIVVDGKAYRREYDESQHVYIMSFNDHSKSKELIDLFNLRPIEKSNEMTTFWDKIRL